MAVLRVAVARSLRRLAGALALTVAVGSAAGAEPAPRTVQDPHYGDGLFHFYQDQYFTALVGLMVSQHFERVGHHAAEAEVLRGLTRPPRTLSFEFTTIQRDVAAECLGLLTALGYRAFNACLGESMAFEHARPVDAATMGNWISALPQAANSGDVYASLEPDRLA